MWRSVLLAIYHWLPVDENSPVRTTQWAPPLRIRVFRGVRHPRRHRECWFVLQAYGRWDPSGNVASAGMSGAHPCGTWAQTKYISAVSDLCLYQDGMSCFLGVADDTCDPQGGDNRQSVIQKDFCDEDMRPRLGPAVSRACERAEVGRFRTYEGCRHIWTESKH